MNGTSMSELSEIIRQVNFFLVGAPKCGTTAMHRYLSNHPDVFMPEIKEINYFGSDLIYNLSYSVSKHEYEAFFAPAGPEQCLGESSVMYLYSQTAASEIYEYNPNAKILIMLRDPVETMYSHHSQLISTADEDILDFETALEAEERRREGLDVPKLNLIMDYLFYREIVQFTKQVRRYIEIFGRERVHVIIFDDFKNDTASCYREVLKFLDLDTDHKPDFERVNANKQIRWTGLRDFIKSPPALVREPVRRLTPLSLRRRMREVLKNLNSRETKRPQMGRDLQMNLKNEFRAEVNSLGNLLGLDLTYWSRID